MKIFVTRKIPDIGISMLRDKGYEVEVSQKEGALTKAELIVALKAKPYDAVICLLNDQIDEEVLAAAPSVKIFSNFAVGFNNIDLKAAAEKKVLVTNTPGTSDESVAEHTVALMLAIAHRIVEDDDFVRDGKYTGWDPNLLTGFNLRGLTLGLIGAGHIGEHVATICKNGFGMNVIYYDVKQNEKIEKELGAKFAPTIEEALKEADVVSLHVPLLPTTQHLLNAGHFAMMKKTAILINTSRGPVVDEQALVEALRNGTIRAAGIDVYEKEPHITKGLVSLPNVVLTPHTASSTQEARDGMSKIAALNVIAVLEGQTPPNLAKV
ncbi:TPA: D-glycerate dehydrogenase [Candidatus Taylorbacteria bacterium]|nr:D-glycerate dehydrogenase [Candidatus Taylorbacteria bacterium]